MFNGRAVDANAKKLRPWRRAVTSAASSMFVADPDQRQPLEGALAVAMEFSFVRRDREAVDAVGEAGPRQVDPRDQRLLTDAGVWKDDGQVTTISARKIYGPTPGARVSVYREKE